MRSLALLIFVSGISGLYVHHARPDIWNKLVAATSFQQPVIEEPAAIPSQAPASEALPPFVFSDPIPTQDHWDWTTSDGRTYRDVRIQSVDADAVTILYCEGGAMIDIAMLRPELQRMLHYDRAIAEKWRARRAADEKYSQAALALENIQAQIIYDKKISFFDHQRAEASGDYSNDMAFVTSHVRINPTTGRAEGNPYFVKRYEENRRLLAQHEQGHVNTFGHAVTVGTSSESHTEGSVPGTQQHLQSEFNSQHPTSTRVTSTSSFGTATPYGTTGPYATTSTYGTTAAYGTTGSRSATGASKTSTTRP